MVAAKANTELPMQLLADDGGTLLVIAPREGLAKRVENTLRNAGHPLRALWTADFYQFERMLRQTPPDLVLCDKDMPQAPEREVIALCKQLYPDLPVVLLAGEHSMECTVAALAAGAVDCCAHNDPAALRHLELVVVREFSKHAQVRALRLTQQRFSDFRERHQHLTAGTADAMATVHEGILADVNMAFARLLSYDSAEELIQQPLIDLIAVDQRAKVKERLRLILKGKHSGEMFDLAFIGRQGKVSTSAQLILGKDDGESVIELLIRMGGESSKPVVRAADLPHRTLFANAMKSVPAQEGVVIGAVLAHIDGFDALERRIGHVQALEITMQLAHAIHARLGPQDQSFAFSANEQSLLLQRESHTEIEQFAESLRKELGAQLFHTDRHEAHVTLSMAIHPLTHRDESDNVIAQLVDGVRKASIKGGDRVVVLGVTPQARQVGHDIAHRVVMVKKALEFNRMKVAYQAIASLEGDERKLFEVLVRLIDEAGKEWYAADFLPAATQAKLMKLIDRWVVQRALAAVGRRSAAASEPSVFFVKLSEDTLTNAETFIEWLKGELKGKALRCDEIVFQLQEVIVQNHVGKIATLAASLRELGAGVSLDHFGIGNTSIQLLDRIPVSFVKFHASFTQEFADANMQKRLGELVEAAKHRGIKTVVSHVEDAHVMARLWQLGVNFVQGFHVQEPEVVQATAEVGARSSG